MSEQDTEKPVILMIDDSKVIRRAAIKMLGDSYEVLEALNGREGLQVIQENTSISVVFSDIQMPEMDGIELLTHIRESDDERVANIPVIILTGHGDNEETKQEVFDKGATDFITKPFDSITLLSRAKSYAKLNRKIVELGEKSGLDEMTGLYNANGFSEQGKKALSFANRHYLDICAINFEIIDFQKLFLSHGKAVAQHVIKVVGKKLKEAMRTEDIAARMGVAKYALLLPMTSSAPAVDIANRVRASINKLVFDTGKEKLRVSLAAGIVPYDRNEEISFVEFYQRVDETLADAHKQAGEKISVVVIEGHAQQTVSDDDIKNAMEHVLTGSYENIDDDHLRAVAGKLKPFLEYVDSRLMKRMTGSD